jgi:hypothetical protein
VLTNYSSERENRLLPSAFLNASGGRVSTGSSQLWQVVPTSQTAPFIRRMELAGAFEMFFLKTIRDEAAGTTA